MPRSRRSSASTAVPEWARGGHAPIDTGGLTLTLKAKVAVQGPTHDQGSLVWFRLPKQLAPGWYVVTTSYGGRPYQVMIQVTNLAVYAMVTDHPDRGLGELACQRPAPSRAPTVSLAGASLGRTDSDGPAHREDARAGHGRERCREPGLRRRPGQQGPRRSSCEISRQGMCGKCTDGDDGRGLGRRCLVARPRHGPQYLPPDRSRQRLGDRPLAR